MRIATLSLRLTGLWALTAPAFLGACHVTPPTPEEVRAFGFETPVQAFQSFAVALRADWPREEYRCFSSTFKERNSLSALGYLEFRDHMLKSQPLLRWALGRATRDPKAYQITDLDPNHLTKLVVSMSGRTLVVILRREDFYEVLGSPDHPLDPAELWIDDNVPDLQMQHHIGVSEDQQRLLAQVPNPGRDLDRLVSLRLGREWKIEDLYVAEERDAKP